MKKAVLWFIVSAIVIGVVGYGVSRLVLAQSNLPGNLPGTLPTVAAPVASATPPANTATPQATATAQPRPTTPGPMAGFKDATYPIDNKPVTLVNGLAEEAAAPGSATKIVTRFFGNEAPGDLNGDGKADVAFILTQNSGGSGTFYFVAAALQAENGYRGLNAILLGDRISPQSVAIENGVIVVKYLDRKPNESFVTQPSVTMSKSIQLTDGKLVEKQATGSAISGRAWTWVHTQMNDGTLTTPKKAEAFTITFNPDGSLSGTTDCNRYFGSYTLNQNKLSFGPFGATKMFCSESQESVFLKFLGEVDGYLLNEKDKTLVLTIRFDSGSMLFK